MAFIYLFKLKVKFLWMLGSPLTKKYPPQVAYTVCNHFVQVKLGHFHGVLKKL